jgi:hypothetical protein
VRRGTKCQTPRVGYCSRLPPVPCSFLHDRYHCRSLEEWSPDELKDYLAGIVDHISTEKDKPVSPLDVALQLFGGELEAFVLFGRMGHLDPPRPDGKVPIAVLQQRSADPEIDAKLRDAAKQWAVDQEGRS